MPRPSRSRLSLRCLALVAALLAAACGGGGAALDPTDSTPGPGGGAAGTCPVGTPDCDDTPGAPAGPVPQPGDDDAAPEPGGDGVLTPEDALALATGDAQVAVRGALYADDTGTYLCGALAESFPPQCASGALLLGGFDAVSAGIETTSAQGVTWTDRTITLSGTVTDGVMTVSDVEG